MPDLILSLDQKIPFDYSVPRPCKKCGGIFSGRFCATCSNAARKIRRAGSKESEKLKNKAHKDKNKEKYAESLLKYRKNNPDKVRASKKKYYEENKLKAIEYAKAYRLENREALLRKALEYRSKNKEKKKIAASVYRSNNLEKVKAQISKWASANPDSNRVRVQNRRARRDAAGGVLSKGLAKKLFVLQRGKCVCCGSPLGESYHLDHITALARGGANTDENMQLLTAKCNMQKHAQDPVEFMQSRGFLI